MLAKQLWWVWIKGTFDAAPLYGRFDEAGDWVSTWQNLRVMAVHNGAVTKYRDDPVQVCMDGSWYDMVKIGRGASENGDLIPVALSGL